MSPFCDLISTKITDSNNSIAIIDSEMNQFTYAELYQNILQKTALIQKAGLKKNDLFILQIDKSFHSLAYLISCIQLGIIYIPIDVDTPSSRLDIIIKSSRAKAILKPDLSIQLFDSASNYQKEGALCVLYTSGSSGIPKGVVISTSGLKSFIDWSIKEFNITSKDLLTGFAPYHFDLSTFDIFSSLGSGATVWLIDQKLAGNFRLVGDHLKSIHPTIWYATPTVYKLLYTYGRLPENYSPRIVLFAGEVFPIKELNALREKWNSSIYYNLYGPTETNVCTYFKLPLHIETKKSSPYPIGVACNFAKTKIGDNEELLIAGSSLMIEYLNNVDETNMNQLVIDNEAWYKTGDKVYLKNQQLFFDGRLDRMVKRNGYRIELDEIEHVLIQKKEINSVAAIAAANNDITKIICYYTGEKKSNIELLNYCNTHLLKYMLPDQFIFINKLPINKNGKIDYRQLIINFNHDE